VLAGLISPGFESRLGHEIMSSEFRHVCYRINILGSQLSLSSINLIPAEAGKVAVGLALRWQCLTDNSGLTSYRLTALGRDIAPRLHSSRSMAHFTF